MPPARRIVTLLTDFGTADTFVGQMKGAILAICPDALVVDLTHEVPPHDVEAGAYLLETACGGFPQGTIHVAVVDPGVGTTRRRVVVRSERHVFVAPDNGILTRALESDPPRAAWSIEERHYMAGEVSTTFEGRDVFAPAAAYIARGTEPSNLGPPVTDLHRLAIPRPRLDPGSPARVRVVLVDRFGNVTLDVDRASIRAWAGGADVAPAIRAETPRGGVGEFRSTYAAGPAGAPFLLFNSADRLEIAVLGGRADETLGLSRGAEVVLHAV